MPEQEQGMVMRYDRNEYHLHDFERHHLATRVEHKRTVARQCRKTRNALIVLNVVLFGLLIATVVQTVRIV